MASLKGFYGKRTQQCFLYDAVNLIQDDDTESSYVAIIGPSTGGQGSNLENTDIKILNTKALPQEIVEEVETFNITNNEIERITSDGEDSKEEPPPAKKQK